MKGIKRLQVSPDMIRKKPGHVRIFAKHTVRSWYSGVIKKKSMRYVQKSSEANCPGPTLLFKDKLPNPSERKSGKSQRKTNSHKSSFTEARLDNFE